MTRVLIGRRWIGCAMAVVLSTGCYREPTHPAQRVPSGPADTGVALGEMPNDDIHAGLAGATSEPGAVIESREVEIGSLLLVAPDEWIRRAPSSQFLITEFSLAKAEGDAEDGRLTVSTAGGTVEDNVGRWKGQFGDKPEQEAQETVDAANLKITVVDFSGTFNDARGMFAPATPKAGYRMLGAVIPLEGQLFFIKAYGPAKTVAAHEERIRGFIQSIKPKTSTAVEESGGTP
jgi:hypothetical protein